MNDSRWLANTKRRVCRKVETLICNAENFVNVEQTDSIQNNLKIELVVCGCFVQLLTYVKTCKKSIQIVTRPTLWCMWNIEESIWICFPGGSLKQYRISLVKVIIFCNYFKYASIIAIIIYVKDNSVTFKSRVTIESNPTASTSSFLSDLGFLKIL